MSKFYSLSKGVLKRVPLIIFFLTGCVSFPELKEVERGNFKNIFYGRYPHKTWALREKEKRIEILEKEFLKRSGIFIKISKEFTGLKVKGFRYLYTAFDKENRKTVVKFFGDLEKRHRIYAGVSIQIVLDEAGKIEAFYISEVPYE